MTCRPKGDTRRSPCLSPPLTPPAPALRRLGGGVDFGGRVLLWEHQNEGGAVAEGLEGGIGNLGREGRSPALFTSSQEGSKRRRLRGKSGAESARV